MTKVFITRTGTKFHVARDCPSFDDLERERGVSIERWPRDLKGLSQSACAVCWPREPGYDAWRQFELKVEQSGDSPYEALLVEKVLRHVPGLRPVDVATQVRAIGRSGKTYFLDFVVSPEDGHRIAIEIDGYDKSPGTKSPHEVQQDVDAKRADLKANGWRVLNFRNERVATSSDQCVDELRAELRDAVPPRIASLPVAPRSGVTGQTTVPGSQALGKPKRRWLPWSAAGVALLAGAIGVAIWSDESKPVSPPNGQCGTAAPIKGNISASGEKIYHSPGWEYYTRTGAEECFKSSEDAESAGYRASEIQ